jgi:hypothetical protein|tara:strand:- start:378 stop:695 length:318 start_codon:yes stop_codon:yes gene_type:complete
MAEITHKKGDTLEWVISLTENAAAVDISDFSIRAQIRQTSTLIATLTTTITNASGGVFSLTATATNTASWTVGTHSCDIEFTDNSGDVFSTETFKLKLIDDITYD